MLHIRLSLVAGLPGLLVSAGAVAAEPAVSEVLQRPFQIAQAAQGQPQGNDADKQRREREHKPGADHQPPKGPPGQAPQMEKKPHGAGQPPQGASHGAPNPQPGQAPAQQPKSLQGNSVPVQPPPAPQGKPNLFPTPQGDPAAKSIVPVQPQAPQGVQAPSPAPVKPALAPPSNPPRAPGAAPAAAVPPAAPSAGAPQRFDQIQKGRQERVEDGGRRTVIQEPGNRVIIKQDNRVFIQHDEGERFRTLPGAKMERRPDGITESFYVRPDGFRVVSEFDREGRLMRRYRRGPDGREFGIIDNRRFLAGLAVGVGVVAAAAALDIGPPMVRIPRDRYIVDYRAASDEDLYQTLIAPPVDRLDRPYSLDEIRYSYQLRDRMRRVDLDDINFEFGGYDVTPDQFTKLERLAHVIDRITSRNPEEVFLIEGYTDAVGSETDNLSLSDRRAEAVAQVLTDVFHIAPENLVTQGYGKQFLKIDTPEPERANRRVAVRRITPLMAQR